MRKLTATLIVLALLYSPLGYAQELSATEGVPVFEEGEEVAETTEQAATYAEHLAQIEAEKQGAVQVGDSIAGLGTDLQITDLKQELTTIYILPPYGPEIVAEETPEAGVIALHIPGSELQEAGIYQVYLEQNGTQLEAAAQFEVLPESMDVVSSSIQLSRDTLEPNGIDSLEVRVVLRDRYGNALAHRPVRVISSRMTDSIREITSETDETGEQLFAISTNDVGTITLRAMDLLSGRAIASQVSIAAGVNMQAIGGFPPSYNQASYQQPVYTQASAPQQYQGPTLYGNTSNSQSIATTQNSNNSNLLASLNGRKLYGQVANFGIVDHFVLDAPGSMDENVYDNLTITALDRDGRVVEDYVGTVNLASTDPEAVLPSFSQVEFRAADLGSKTLVLGLRFGTIGEHLLYAEDSQNASVSGQTTVNVKGEVITEPEQTITILSPVPDSQVSTATVTVTGKAPAYLNLIVTGGTVDTYGESDLEGNFSIDVDLHPGQIDHTLRVRDESGRNDSGNLRIRLDDTPPVIQTFSFTPSTPKEGEDILMVVEATDGNAIQSVVMQLENTDYALDPVPEAPGTYQTLFALETAGDYQPKIVVTDGAGHVAEMLSSISVKHKGLPTVQNVVAEPSPDSVSLTWDPLELEDPVDTYRIYVGDTPDNFLFTLDTEKDTTAAKVAGLKPSRTYYFAVTGILEDTESLEKSEVVEALIPGIELSVRERDSRLELSWIGASAVSIGNYMLEYGVEPGIYLESRTINGEANAYTLGDLLNDVTYYIQLTPISTTGEVMEDLTTTAEGTPSSALGGFTPGPADPAPAGLQYPVGSSTIDEPTHSGAPQPPVQPVTGIPFSKWWIVTALAAVVGIWYGSRRRSLQISDAFMQQMNAQYDQAANDTQFPHA